MLRFIFDTYEQIITVEDGCKIGGFGSAILEFANALNNPIPISIYAIDDVFIEHGTVEELHKMAHLDDQSIKKLLLELLEL
jgi:1-deoxy-D-xylulose-5-phosphate synthase